MFVFFWMLLTEAFVIALHLLRRSVCDLCEFFASNTLTQNTPTNSADARNHRVWLHFIRLCGCVWVCVAYRCLNTLFLLDGEFQILSAAFK